MISKLQIDENGEKYYITDGDFDSSKEYIEVSDGAGSTFLMEPEDFLDNKVKDDEDVVPYMVELLENMGYKISSHGNSITVSSTKKDVEPNVSVPTSEKTVKAVSSSNSGVTLLDVLKKNTSNQIKAQDYQNSLLVTKNKLLEDQNKLIASQTNAILEQNKLLAISNGVAGRTLIHQKEQNKILKTLNNAVALNSKSTKKYHDFLFNGDDNIVDSNGDKIKPLETKAKKDAELAIAEKAENETNYFDDTISLLNDVFDIEDGNDIKADDGNILKAVIDKFIGLDPAEIDNIKKELKGLDYE